MNPPVLLAFDTSTEVMSLALLRGGELSVREGEGGAQASMRLIPEALRLLSDAGCALRDVDAIAFGRGPGAFTGLRTACSVAQGLAFGAHKPVLPVDSLLLVAEDALAQVQLSDCWVAMDARMDEVYAARYRWDGQRWHTEREPALYTLEALAAQWRAQPPAAVAGSAIEAFGDRLPVPSSAKRVPQARSRGAALASLAQQGWQQGAAIDAAQALPLYLRDKVALTTAEREAAKKVAA
ncbi:MAG: tRNA (adenosine(37)-N6)-threonylcarbamoyltransferase complex dimerization subunit type 1 TsaB [Betaproteobacteria bacterium]|nr:MAG: tRNA (adenosine(37)-N6)-threonylcarbamoyltransferase complex dimerization subunit type 1 TsaB [Betaproteobacteria bacterium]